MSYPFPLLTPYCNSEDHMNQAEFNRQMNQAEFNRQRSRAAMTREWNAHSRVKWSFCFLDLDGLLQVIWQITGFSQRAKTWSRLYCFSLRSAMKLLKFAAIHNPFIMRRRLRVSRWEVIYSSSPFMAVLVKFFNVASDEIMHAITNCNCLIVMHAGGMNKVPVPNRQIEIRSFLLRDESLSDCPSLCRTS